MKYSIKTKLDVEAYERDGFQCVECGRTKGILAHHIIPEIEELDNLITLCHSCHSKKHDMVGFKKGFDKKRHPVSRERFINMGKATQFQKGHSFAGNQYTGGIRAV